MTSVIVLFFSCLLFGYVRTYVCSKFISVVVELVIVIVIIVELGIVHVSYVAASVSEGYASIG